MLAEQDQVAATPPIPRLIGPQAGSWMARWAACS